MTTTAPALAQATQQVLSQIRAEIAEQRSWGNRNCTMAQAFVNLYESTVDRVDTGETRYVLSDLAWDFLATRPFQWCAEPLSRIHVLPDQSTIRCTTVSSCDCGMAEPGAVWNDAED